jgi:hypothetical protein
MNKLAFAAIACGLLAGCAGTQVTEDQLQQKTAFTLGVDPSDLTISDKVKVGTLRTNYVATTKKGKKFMCWVEAGPSLIGQIVSDPRCTETGKN